jgi:hypothetical protein
VPFGNLALEQLYLGASLSHARKRWTLDSRTGHVEFGFAVSRKNTVKPRGILSFPFGEQCHDTSV